MKILVFKTGLVITALTLLMILLGTCIGASAHTHTRRRRSVPAPIFHALPHLASVSAEDKAAEELGLTRFMTEQEVLTAVQQNVLVPLPECRALRIDKRLPMDHRYARPEAVAFVQRIAEEHYVLFHKSLQVNSAVRSADYQKKLVRHNRNAAPAEGAVYSSHEFGNTLDLYKKMSKAERQWLVVRLLYYRETQRVLAIQEKGCWHLFVRA